MILVPVSVLVLIWFLDRTTDRQDRQGVRHQPPLARLSSICPSWSPPWCGRSAAVLSTLSRRPHRGRDLTAAGLGHPRAADASEALAAAVIAGMRSFRVAVIAAVAIGVIQSVLTYNFLAVPGITDLLLFIAVFVAVIFARREGGEEQVFAFSPRANPIPERLRSFWWARNIDKGGILFLGLIAVLLPIVVDRAVTPAALHGRARLRHLRLVADGVDRVGWDSSRWARWPLPAWRHSSQPGWSPRASRSGSAVVSHDRRVRALGASGIGIGSLRVRGLYLAVVTFVFALTAQQYFYFLPFFSGDSPDGANVAFPPGQAVVHLFPRTTGLLLRRAGRSWPSSCWCSAGSGTAVWAGRSRRSGTTRPRLPRIRVPPVRVKLQAFSLAGALAGLGGACLPGPLPTSRSPRTSSWSTTPSTWWPWS